MSIELKSEFLDMTVGELLKHLSSNKPQKNMSYILHLSAYGVCVTKGQESTHYHTQEQSIMARGDESFEMVVKSNEEKKKAAPRAVLTKEQEDRKSQVLAGKKLSEKMLEQIRIEELNDNEFWINRQGYCYGAGYYDKTEQALKIRGIMFSSEICKTFKLKHPLAWMTDEGFSIWRGDSFDGSVKEIE